MKPIDQTVFGENGNCLQACIASLFEVGLELIPHFPSSGQFLALERWLAGFDLAPLALSAEQKIYHWDSHYLMWGKSSRGLRHSVIGFGGKVVHDPHPDRTGLETVEQICIIVKSFKVQPTNSHLFLKNVELSRIKDQAERVVLDFWEFEQPVVTENYDYLGDLIEKYHERWQPDRLRGKVD